MDKIITVDQVNKAIYKSMTELNRAKPIPRMSEILSESDTSKRLIFIAKSHFRSEVLENFLTSLFISLYFVFDTNERKLIIISKITYLISRVYHKNFTSLGELQQWAKENKHPSIWKLLVVNLLELVI